MVNNYGDETEPGIITEESSSNSIETSGTSPNDILMVGPADLNNANNPAEEGMVYEVGRDTTAESRFGPPETSLITTAILDQLREGAAPVFAVAPPSTDVTGEDHSGETTTTIDLQNAPASEIEADYTLTLDGTELTPIFVEGDVSTKTPEAGEAYVNPVQAQVELPESADTGTGLTADYTHFDYASAFDTLAGNQEAAEASDFLIGLQEEATVQQDVVDTAKEMSTEQNYTIALVTPDGGRLDVDSFENPYDSSRVQVEYPPRYEDRSSALAAYAGTRASLGLNRAPISQPLQTDKRLSVSLSKSERGSLIQKNVVPLENRTGGAVIKDDPTTVTDENTDESNIKYGFQRLALDYTYEVAEENEQPFIGRLHDPAVRNALADLIGDQLTAMKQSDIIDAFNVRVFEESATRARLELDLDAPDPLRFIENKVRIGEIN
jgi:hypothetical protein